MRYFNIFYLPNPSSPAMALRFTQRLSGSKEQPARNADNLTALCEPIV
jgi:hypothetical protein